jgi:hypothetical protein
MKKSTGVGRGGRRPGAGRPRKWVKLLVSQAPFLAPTNGSDEAVLQALATIKGLLEKQNVSLTQMCQQRRNEHESLPAVLRRIVEIERLLKSTELHIAARHTRRRPLGME